MLGSLSGSTLGMTPLHRSWSNQSAAFYWFPLFLVSQGGA